MLSVWGSARRAFAVTVCPKEVQLGPLEPEDEPYKHRLVRGSSSSHVTPAYQCECFCGIPVSVIHFGSSGTGTTCAATETFNLRTFLATPVFNGNFYVDTSAMWAVFGVCPEKRIILRKPALSIENAFLIVTRFRLQHPGAPPKIDVEDRKHAGATTETHVNRISPCEPGTNTECSLDGVVVVERVGEHSMTRVWAFTPDVDAVPNAAPEVALVAPYVSLVRALDDDELHGFNPTV